MAENDGGAAVGDLTTTDPDAGDTFTYTLVDTATFPDNASFSITDNHLATVAPFDFETQPTASIKVRSTDAGGLFFEKTLTVTITDVNEAPTAVDDSYPVPAAGLTVDAPGVLGNDTDPDASDTHTAVPDSNPAHTSIDGSFTFNADGSFSVTLDSGFSGSDSFTYHAHDAGGLDSNVATVTLSTNTPPVAVADTGYSVNEDTQLSVPAGPGPPPGVLGNDSDADVGDTITAELVTGPSNASAFTLNADGSFTYTGAADFNGGDSSPTHAKGQPRGGVQRRHRVDHRQPGQRRAGARRLHVARTRRDQRGPRRTERSCGHAGVQPGRLPRRRRPRQRHRPRRWRPARHRGDGGGHHRRLLVLLDRQRHDLEPGGPPEHLPRPCWRRRQHAALLPAQRQLQRHGRQRPHLPGLGPDVGHQRQLRRHLHQRQHDRLLARHRHRSHHRQRRQRRPGARRLQVVRR